MRMSEQEALMWHLEKDPYLLSNFGAISIMGRGFDYEHFTHKVQNAVIAVPRLRRRVLPSMGRLQPPRWAPDREFDLSCHLYRIALPAPGNRQQLIDFCSRLLNEPFDRTRPLWQFVIIEGLADGGTALFTKMHHTVTDGLGGIRIAEQYMDFEHHTDDPGPTDLDEYFVKDAADEPVQTNSTSEVFSEATELLMRGGEIARKALGEIALGAADPSLLVERGLDAVRGGKAIAGQLKPDENSSPSPLWSKRSRRRSFHTLSLPQDAALNAARSMGGKLNDLFVTAAVEAACRYHDEFDAPVETLNISFIVSTYGDAKSKGSNSFTPMKASVPTGAMSLEERFATISAILEEKKSQVTGPGMMSQLARPANLLPTSLLTQFARGQAAGLDLSTSNVRAAPFTVYIAGSKLLATYPMGPVAGTAGNITLMSYNGTLDVGLNLDPAAIEHPQKLADHFAAAAQELSK